MSEIFKEIEDKEELIKKIEEFDIRGKNTEVKQWKLTEEARDNIKKMYDRVTEEGHIVGILKGKCPICGNVEDKLVFLEEIPEPLEEAVEEEKPSEIFCRKCNSLMKALSNAGLPKKEIKRIMGTGGEPSEERLSYIG